MKMFNDPINHTNTPKTMILTLSVDGIYMVIYIYSHFHKIFTIQRYVDTIILINTIAIMVVGVHNVCETKDRTENLNIQKIQDYCLN